MICPDFARLHCYLLARFLNDPNAIGWQIEIAGELIELNNTQLVACTLVIIDRLKAAWVENFVGVVTQQNSGLSWLSIDLACAALGKIHAAIDARIPADAALHLRESLAGEQHQTPFLKLDEDDFLDAALLSQAEYKIKNQPEQIQDFAVVEVRRYERKLNDCKEYETTEFELLLDQPACIIHTSGSVHRPKAVLLSHRNLIFNALGKLGAMPQNVNDRRLNILPFSHAYARTCELSTWLIAGGTMLCVNDPRKIDSLAKHYRPTLINAVPAFWKRICEDAKQHGRFNQESLLGGELRMIASGGAPLDGETFSAYKDIGLSIRQGYGLSETSPVVCSNRFDKCSADSSLSVGVPIDGVSVRIDANGQLHIAGSGLMLGYWHDPAATEARIVDGWLATGDLASQATDGSIRIDGRIDDQICLPNGYKILPQELEAELRRIDLVEDCVVVAVRQMLVAVFELSDSALYSNGELQQFETLHDKVAQTIKSWLPYARIEKIVVVSEQQIQDWRLKNFKGAWHRLAVARFAKENLG